MTIRKPLPLFDSAVLVATGGASAVSLAVKVLSIDGLGTQLPLGDIIGMTRTVFAAWTPQVNTLDFAACSFVSGQAVHLTVKRLDDGTTKRYDIIANGTSTSDVRDQFVASISNDLTSVLTAAAGGGSTMTLTENEDVEGFVVTELQALATNVLTTPHVAPAGDYAEVSQYDASAPLSGEFTKYNFYVKKEVVNSGATNDGHTKGHVVVFAEENDGDYAAFDAALVAALDASGITDAVVEPYVAVI